MAKIIRCPNCGENVEIPPNPTGQIVTCVACGTAMRLKSRKDAGDKSKGDSSQGSLSGSSLSGSMSATRVTDQVQASPDDPPSLGGECEVCGRPTDPDELVEDRGHLTCRDCIKGARSSRPRAANLSEGDLIPFAGPMGSGVRRASMITFGMPFVFGAAALVLYVACNVFLSFNPKPIGKGVIVKADEPAPTSQSAWESANRQTLIDMMKEANALKADPNRTVDALAKYDAIVAMAKGQSIGSQDVRRIIDEAEREATGLRVAMTNAPSTGAPPPPVPAPGEATAADAPPTPPVQVPEDVAKAPDSVLDDAEVAITDKLHAGMTSLEKALAAMGPAAEPHAKEALDRFGEARSLLIHEKRNFPEDPGWTLANHGTAVAYTISKNFGYALTYLKRLPAPPDRAALLNHVVVLLQMREEKAEAIRLLLSHLESPAGADDSYALNLLGTALARYPEEVIRKDEALSNAQRKYDEIVKRQGAKHPGERRWGVRWVGINEWEALDKQRRIDANKIDVLERALTKVRVRINEARLPSQKAQVPAYQAEEAKLLADIDAIRAKSPSEEWLTPEQIVPVLPDVSAVNARSRGASGAGGATTAPAAGG